jgi:predicted HicB family RNase H-like nuclease
MHASNARKDQNKGGAASEDELIETAAMTVRVPRQHRIHWLISAKKQGTSLTAAITEALNARFGEPTD